MKNKILIIIFTTLLLFFLGCSKDPEKKTEDCFECEDCNGLIKTEECPDCPTAPECPTFPNCLECPIEKSDEFIYILKDGYLQVTGVKNLINEKIIIPDEALYDGVKYPVESVNLVNNDYQKDVYLGKNIKEVQQLKNIKSIEISSENKYFSSKDGVLYNKECTKLLYYPSLKESNEYVLDEKVHTIEKNAFNGNEYIKRLVINGSEMYFENSSLMNCINLEEVIFNSENIEIYLKDNVFENCVNLTSFKASTIHEIGSRAFFNCYSLEKFEVTDHIIKVIKEYAFENCYSLTDFISSNNSIGIGDDLVLKTTVDRGIFKNCYKLKNFTLNQLKGISNEMFYNCYSLEEIVLPSDKFLIEGYVDEYAFVNCINLKKAVIYEYTRTFINSFVNCENLVLYAKCNEFSSNWQQGFCDNEIIYNK